MTDINIIGDYLSPGSTSFLIRTLYYSFTKEYNLDVKLIHKPSIDKVIEDPVLTDHLKHSDTLPFGPISLHICFPRYELIPDTLNVLWNQSLSPIVNNNMKEAHNGFAHVLTQFNVDDLNKAIGEKVKYLPVLYPVPNFVFNSKDLKAPILNYNVGYDGSELKEKPYTFLSTGLLHERSGMLELIYAYVNSFTSNDKVTLLLKINNVNRDINSDGIKSFINDIKGKTKNPNPPEIVLVNEILDDISYVDFLNNADCYVNVRKWDSLFSDMFLAASLDKTIISSNYNNPYSLFTESGSFTYDSNQDYQINATDVFIEKNDTWFNHSILSLSNSLKKVYGSYLSGGEGFKKKKKYNANLMVNHNTDNSVKNLLNLFFRMIERYPQMSTHQKLKAMFIKHEPILVKK